jgi:plasmid stability protein
MATLTLRNVPDELYERLKADAKRNGRSLNQEAIRGLRLSRGFRSEEENRRAFEAARQFREEMAAKGVRFDHSELKAMIEEGRE